MVRKVKIDLDVMMIAHFALHAYHGDWYQFHCYSTRSKLSIGYCMTWDETGPLFVTKCPYFQLEGHNKCDLGNFKLPDNISELNDYMCGPMNRKGFFCKDLAFINSKSGLLLCGCLGTQGSIAYKCQV